MTNMFVRNQFFMNPKFSGNRVKTSQGDFADDVISQLKEATQIEYTDYSVMEILCTWLRTSEIQFNYKRELWNIEELSKLALKSTFAERTKLYNMLTTDKVIKRIKLYLPDIKRSNRDFVFGDLWYSIKKITDEDIIKALQLQMFVHPFSRKFSEKYLRYGTANFIDMGDTSYDILKEIDFPITSVRNLLASLSILYTNAVKCNNMDIHVSMRGNEIILWTSDNSLPYMVMPYARFVVLYEQDLIKRVAKDNFAALQITDYVGERV